MTEVREHHVEFDPEEPLLDLEDLAELADKVSSNDEWAFTQADRMIKSLPQRVGKDRRTEGEVFDHPTLMTLHKFLLSGAIKSLDFPISTGKEANVFRGTTPEGGFVAVKIYRVNTATFKHVLQYIQGDERFENVTGDKRALVYAWAQKEFRNLLRMREAGMDVPEPIRVLNNVLIIEYIGTEEGPYPRLKEMGRLDKKQAENFWEILRNEYRLCYDDAGLVHGDLSEYNILVDGAGTKHPRPRIIDVGQAVLRNHPMAWEFLARDAKNLTNYFNRQQVRLAAADLTNHLRKAP
jgi:RIO kinase 1